jgi:hypothetical protein
MVKKLSESKGYGDASFVLSLLGGIFVLAQGILMVTFALFFGYWWGMTMPIGGWMMSPEMYEHMSEEHGYYEFNGGTNGVYGPGMMWGINPMAFLIAIGVIAIVFGIIIFFGAMTMKSDIRTGGILVLVIGAISLFTGTWLGALFAIIGGILALID